MRSNTCWDLWQICICCANELIDMKVIDFKIIVNATRCYNEIKNELFIEPEPDYPMIIKIKRKKAIKSREFLEKHYGRS